MNSWGQATHLGWIKAVLNQTQLLVVPSLIAASQHMCVGSLGRRNLAAGQAAVSFTASHWPLSGVRSTGTYRQQVDTACWVAYGQYGQGCAGPPDPECKLPPNPQRPHTRSCAASHWPRWACYPIWAQLLPRHWRLKSYYIPISVCRSAFWLGSAQVCAGECRQQLDRLAGPVSAFTAPCGCIRVKNR